MFGAGFYRGHKRAQERTNTRRAKVFDAFQRWKADNPYATAADFQNAVRAIGGGDLTVANSLPGQQAIQRMASENQRRKQEDDLRKKRAAISEQLQMQNTMLGLVSNAVQMYGDKVDANMLSQQFGVPADMIQPALDQAQAKAAQAKAEKDQAAQLEALKEYNMAANAALSNGLTVDDAIAAGQAASNRYLKAAGVDVSLGNVGAPSQFASNIDAANADLQAQYDARVAKEARDAANSIRTLFGSNASLQDLLINDEQEAINAAFSFAGLDLDDDVAAAVRADLEGTIGEMSRQIREQRDNAAVQTITPLFESARDADPNSVVDPQAAAEAAVNAAVAQGNMTAEVAEAAIQTVLSNTERARTEEYNAQYQPANPADVINAAVAERARAAGEIVAAMTGKPNQNGVTMFGTEPVITGTLDPALIADALSDIDYDSPAQAQDIATFMAKTMMEMKGDKNGGTATKEQLIKAVTDNFEVDTFSGYLAGEQDTLLLEINDNFASTAELIEVDFERQEAIDQNYGDLDITRAGIAEASVGTRSERQAALGAIQAALNDMIAQARAYQKAFAQGRVGIGNMTGVDPQARLAFGAELDREAFAAAIQQRIDELEDRYLLTEQAMASNSSVVNTADAGLNPRRMGDAKPITSFITVGGRGRATGKHVSFTEAINAGPEARKLFEDSITATFEANGQRAGNALGLAEGAPTIYAAVMAAVPDERVVTALAQGLEAFDYFHAAAPRGRSNSQTNGRYTSLAAQLELPDSDKSGVVDRAVRDRHAQYFALSWFRDAIAGMDESQQDALVDDFIKILEALDRGSMEGASPNLHGLITLDLPRLRESAF
jgi:hypothetical protein